MDVRKTLFDAAAAMRRGALTEAERECRSVLELFPGHFQALVLLGEVLTRAGRETEGFAAFDCAAAVDPGQSFLFTGLAIRRFRKAFGACIPARPQASLGVGRVQMRFLGINGRFGNQLLQYAFVRLYAMEHGLSAEFPDWIGRDIFDLDDPFPSAQLPRIDEKDIDLFGSLQRRTGQVFAGKDINGYFCGNTIQWGPRAEEFRALFVPGRKVRGLLDQAMDRLRGIGKTIVAVHLRRGDFGYGRFWVAPPAWYLAWLSKLWPSLDEPVLYLALEDRKYLSAFAEFSPWDARRIGVEIPGADFLIDHHILRHADQVAISNSTFSFTAAMLNERAKSFMRPDPGLRELVPFDPWASPVLLDPAIRPDEVDAAETKVLPQLFSTTDQVLHLGRFCSPWTNLARATNKDLRVHEENTDMSVDVWRRENEIPHLRHLVVEDADHLPAVVRGARETLRHARVDMIHYRVLSPILPDTAETLARYGYSLFRTNATGVLNRTSINESSQPGRYVAMQERLLHRLSDGRLPNLDLPGLCRQYGIAVRGVIHVGAHEGQEISSYDAMRAERVMFIEANPAVYARLAAAMRERAHVTTVNRAISDKNGKVQLHLASFDQSSSLLPLARHREVYPQILAAGTTDVDATTLDALVQELGFSASEFNFLNVDVQGAEAMVLRGAINVLRHIEGINIEVNFSELYRGGAQIEDIDDLLEAAGFRRVATLSAYHESWGDAFYVRN
jgi:FkbM family methyltransferase